jgi:hypothetical protein
MKRKSIRTYLQEQELEAIPIVEEGAQKSNAALEQNNVITQNNVKREKISFYPAAGQSTKLLDLMERYRKHLGVPIKQQEMLRLILDKITLEDLLP